MRPRDQRRFAVQLESLEGRKAPSAGLSSSLHPVAEVHRAGDDNLPRHSGRDDGANRNDRNDNDRNDNDNDNDRNDNDRNDNDRHGR